MTASLAVVVPTRSRPELTRNAVRSLLQQDCELEIVVSDNSPAPDAVEDLGATDSRVHVLRPRGELSVADHWDWALRQTMERSAATHFVLHHDRRWALPRSWGAVAGVAAKWPDDLITVGIDSITDTPPPLRLWQTPWTGKTFEIRTSRAAQLVADARISSSAHALPLLNTSVVPRSVLTSVIARFGDICRSTGPDTAFMARFLALHDRYLHADRVTGVMYASHRSSNLGYLRNEGGDFSEYVRLHGSRPWLDAAPVPGVNLGSNMLFHEYELVRRETGDRLPALDRAACVRELGAGLRWVTDPRRRHELAGVLAEHGWVDDSRSAGNAGAGTSVPDARSAWRIRVQQAKALLAARCGVPLPTVSGFRFRNDRAALRCALRHPRARQDTHEHLAEFDVIELDG